MSALMVICFTLSGSSSLILQVVWVRQLIRVFGSSSLAIATVLATFMAGLALGSWLGGRLADRLVAPDRAGSRLRAAAGDPLLYYGAAELVVAVSALLIPVMLVWYHDANAWLWLRLGDSPALLALARFALTCLALLLPTTAMGATLPLLSRRVTAAAGDLRALGRRLGALYAVNTAGAVAGAAAAGFYLIPAIGVTGTNRTAAALAVLVGLIMAAASLRRPRPAPEVDSEPAAVADVPEPVVLDRGDRVTAVTLYALSGAIAMVLEVLWSRALYVVIGSSIYSFTLVLCAFLVGLSLGSAMVARTASRTRDPLAPLAIAFLAVATGALVTLLLTDDLPRMFLSLVEGTTIDLDVVMTVHVFLAGLVLIPAALGLGASMPLAIRAYVGSHSLVGTDVGRAYAANTVGAIAGAVGGGFVVLPAIGLEAGTRVAVVAAAVLAAVAAGRSRRPRLRRTLTAAAALVAVGAVLAPRWDLSDFTLGVFRTQLARDYIESGRVVEREIVYYRDGVSTTVTVERYGEGWVLRNNGKVEASNKHDMPTQILVGLVPVIAHGSDQLDVFVVGYGSGVTVGSIGVAPQVASVDVVELEPAVYEAADRYFGGFNNRPQDNPKIRRYVGDGRNVLIAGDRTFDVIVSEPSNPWIAGVASLFSREFYQLAKKHLAPGGVFCQWAQLYELNAPNVKMIYRTFSESFAYVYALTPGDETTDTILLGSDRPLDLNVALFERAMQASPELEAELERAGVASAEDILASLFLTPAETAAFVAGADVNTDDNALLEFSAPRDLLASVGDRLFAHLVRGEGWPYGTLEGTVTGVEGAGALRLARALMTYGRLREASVWLERGRAFAPDRAQLLARVRRLAAPTDFLDPEMAVTEGGPVLVTPSDDLFHSPDAEAVASVVQAYKYIAEARWLPAWQTLRSMPPRADSNEGRDLTLLMGYSAYKALEFRAALRLLEPLAQVPGYADRRPSLRYYLGRANYGMGRFRGGIEQLERLSRDWPELVDRVVADRL